MKLILCRECGGNFQGRLSRTCSAHPRSTQSQEPQNLVFKIINFRAAYLHDVRACIYCLHTDLGKLQEFDLPANKVFKSDASNTVSQHRRQESWLIFLFAQELVAPPGNLKNGQGTPIVEV